MSENDYLEQVMENQRRVEVDLKARKRNGAARAMAAPMRVGLMREDVAAAAPMQEMAADGTGRFKRASFGGFAGGEAMGLADEPSSSAVDVRITGWWRWKTVIVPPNAHVVHTRRGYDKPLHVGLGTSFRYNPATDSFLVVPGTMQTIMINAQCICRELQGLLVQGYVQWIVADFATAYKKLDFTDVDDPMRVVNVQLREQAEAAIKDKVATMSIDEVLSDKQPIIEELTSRLRAVAEGGATDSGLGLRIITVQVKEAVVSSRGVWESLQKPFRSDRARIARLAELETETVIAARESGVARDVATGKLDTEAELGALKARHDAVVFDGNQAEVARRNLKTEDVKRQTAEQLQRTAVQAAALAQAQFAAEAELARTRVKEQAEAKRREIEAAIAIAELERAAQNRQTEIELAQLETRQRIANVLSAENLQARLIEMLPLIAEKLPKPDELRTISIGGGGGSGADATGLATMIAQVMAVVDGFKAAVKP